MGTALPEAVIVGADNTGVAALGFSSLVVATDLASALRSAGRQPSAPSGRTATRGSLARESGFETIAAELGGTFCSSGVPFRTFCKIICC